jgi:hypothetical protein
LGLSKGKRPLGVRAQRRRKGIIPAMRGCGRRVKKTIRGRKQAKPLRTACKIVSLRKETAFQAVTSKKS